MSDKQRLKTIQKDIKTIDKCIDMSIDYDEVDYLKIIKDHMIMVENELKENLHD